MKNLWVCFFLERWQVEWTADMTIDLDKWREGMAWWGATGLIIIHDLPDLLFTMRGKTDIQPPIALHNARTLQAAEAAFSDIPWVYLDQRGPHLLTDFQHPTGDCVYAVGADRTGFKPDDRSEGVRLPYVRDIGSTWAYGAATVALYDRHIKSV